MSILDSSRLAWFGDLLCEQRDKIRHLISRLIGIETSGMKPSLLRKFMCMLDEVASARDKELGLIHEIEDIEKKHRFLRETHQLREAKPETEIDPSFAYAGESKPLQPGRSWLWLLAFWYLLSRQKINQKKQSLTAD